LLEVGWAIGLKYTDGFSKPIPTALTVFAMVLSLVLLGLATKHLPLGTAYAVWVGIGAVGAALSGMVLLGDPVTPLRLAGIALILFGVIALKLAQG